MKAVLVDTDVLIEFLRGKDYARDFLLSLLEDTAIFCSAITVAEIYAGMREHEKGKTADLIDSISIVDVTREIAEKAGIYKRSIKSLQLELDDCIIAATAFVIKAVLSTINVKHYPMTDIEKKIVVPGRTRGTA